MKNEKIKLDEILSKNSFSIETHGEEDKPITVNVIDVETIKYIMIAFAKQLLDRAADNAQVTCETGYSGEHEEIQEPIYIVDRDSITNTLKEVQV